MTDPDPDGRNKRIDQLEARLARRPAVGVMPPLAGLSVVIAAWVIWTQHEDVAYFFAAREPISLGVEGEYRFDQATSNSYAQLHGVPAIRAAYGMEGDQHFVVIGVLNTPLLVKRKALPTEEWTPGKTPPPPDQRSFTASGRLLSRAAAGRFEDAFVKHDGFGQVQPKWLLLEGARPGGDFAAMGWFGLVLAFALVNLWLLIRGLAAIFVRPKT